jgi:hypothetical protein
VITELEDIVDLLTRMADTLDRLADHLGVREPEPEAPKIVDTYVAKLL